MVGVPGRSKACQTCKKRHIACDLRHLQQPKCGQCEKARRRCDFSQSVIFVNHDEGTHKTVYRKSDAECQQAQSLCSEWSIKPRETVSSSANGSNDEWSNMKAFRDSLPPTIHSTSLAKQQILFNARTAVTNVFDPDSEFPQFWSSALTSSCLDSWACRMSPALACYTVWIGRQTEDANLVEASRKLYVQGLREVQKSVNDAETALLDETLSACIGLIIYEALECPDRSFSAYHKHIEGCSTLIKMRGLDAHRDGVGHELFRGFRNIAVLKALQDHRPTYLATPAWSEVPFSLHPKDIHDRLLDILARGANFLGEGDRLATTPPSKMVAALLDIDDRLLALDHELVALYIELEAQHPGPLYWSSAPAIRALDGELSTEATRFETPITFADQGTARLLTLYWAQQCLLRMGRGEIRAALAGMAAAGMVQGKAERVCHNLSYPAKSLVETAHLVLRSRDYCSKAEGTLLRYSVPLSITLDVLANKPEQYAAEIRHAKEMKRLISERFLRITQFTGTLKYGKQI